MPIIGRVGARVNYGGKLYSAEYGSLAGLYTGTQNQREMFELLRVYYQNNGLYDTMRAALYSIGADRDELRPLRNPANRVVEFYAAKLWPGKMPLVASSAIDRAVQQVWVWSNWAARKQVLARWQAMYGNVFVKVSTDALDDPSEVRLELIDPRYVVGFDTDARGMVTYFRVDIPQKVKRRRDWVDGHYTEVWNLVEDSLRTYLHTNGWGVDEKQLGDPLGDMRISEMQLDFVPVTHIVLRDVGEKWGLGAFQAALDKIDEADRQATRLHAILFRNNRALWALMANAQDKSGRPLPPPKLADEDSDGKIDLSGDNILRIPGLGTLEPLVPGLDYKAALDVVNAMMLELEQDLPEMAYYRLMDEKPNLSGRALEMLLGHAVDRVVEARENAETGLIRAQEMALRMGQVLGLEGFTGMGDDLSHAFAVRPVFPLSTAERADILQKLVSSGMALETAMRQVGYSDLEIADALAAKARERAQAQNEAQAYLATQRGL